MFFLSASFLLSIVSSAYISPNNICHLFGSFCQYFVLKFILWLTVISLLWTFRPAYTEMPNGAPTTMIISKHDKDDSNDSFSDEASDLSVQLGMYVLLQ